MKKTQKKGKTKVTKDQVFVKQLEETSATSEVEPLFVPPRGFPAFVGFSQLQCCH